LLTVLEKLLFRDRSHLHRWMWFLYSGRTGDDHAIRQHLVKLRQLSPQAAEPSERRRISFRQQSNAVQILCVTLPESRCGLW
jgi:hypothetical protein